MTTRKTSVESVADPFAKFFDEGRASDHYWIELAKLEFTEMVIARMKALSMKKGDLAKKLKVKPAFVTRILSGKNNFELATMVRIARVLGCEFRPQLQREDSVEHRIAVHAKPPADCDAKIVRREPWPSRNPNAQTFIPKRKLLSSSRRAKATRKGSKRVRHRV